jgi:hypothetical protein
MLKTSDPQIKEAIQGMAEDALQICDEHMEDNDWMRNPEAADELKQMKTEFRQKFRQRLNKAFSYKNRK